MKAINFISSLAMPMIILIVVFYALIERKDVFDNFIDGAKEGIEIVLKIFPTLIRSSGILDIIIRFITPLLNVINFPSELMPLAMLRPISGSGAIAVANDIMKTYGVDNMIGMMASTIMGSTETTIYTIAIYTSSVKIRKTRGILIAALTADIIGMIVSVIACKMIL